MTISQVNPTELKIEFSKGELSEISRTMTAIGIPMSVFGGLSIESPYCKVRLAKAIDALNSINTLGLIQTYLGTSITKLESAPVFVRKQVQSQVANCLRTLPAGLFISKD